MNTQLSRQEGRALSFIETVFNKLLCLIQRHLPNVYEVVLENRNPNPSESVQSLRNRLAFIVGTVYGLLIYWLTINQITELPRHLRALMCLFTSTFIAINMYLSVSMRCVMSLLVFNLLTSAGKLTLTSMLVQNLSRGPVNNTIVNLNNLGTSLHCKYNLFRNLTNLGAQQAKLNGNILKKIFAFNPELARVQKNVDTVQEMNERLTGQLIDPYSLSMRPKRSHKRFFNTQIEYEQHLTNLNKKKCIEAVREPLRDCHSRTNDFGNHCKQSIEDQDYFLSIGIKFFYGGCPTLSGTDQTDICGKKKLVAECAKPPAGLPGHVYEKTQLNRIGLDAKFNTHNIDLNLTPPRLHIENPMPLSNLIGIQLSVQKLEAKFKVYTDYVSRLLELLQLMLKYSSCLVFANSYRYFSAYVTDIGFDNHCLTQYFRHIDQRRLRQAKRTLLPLKEFEKLNHNYPLQLFVSSYQKPNLKLNVLFHLGLFCVVFIFAAVSYVTEDFLTLLHEYSVINYEFKSEARVVLNVRGDGYVANMLKGITNELNTTSRLHKLESTRQCDLPVVNVTREQWIELGTQATLILVCILVELYVKRFNKLLCQFYYYKWEKSRIVWLYNSMLVKRVRFVQNAKKKVVFKKKTGWFDSQLSNSLGCGGFMDRLLRRLVGFGKHCVLCDCVQTLRSQVCDTCHIVYCRDCWLDLERKCVACMPDIYEDLSWEYE